MRTKCTGRKNRTGRTKYGDDKGMTNRNRKIVMVRKERTMSHKCACLYIPRMRCIVKEWEGDDKVELPPFQEREGSGNEINPCQSDPMWECGEICAKALPCGHGCQVMRRMVEKKRSRLKNN